MEWFYEKISAFYHISSMAVWTWNSSQFILEYYKVLVHNPFTLN